MASTQTIGVEITAGYAGFEGGMKAVQQISQDTAAQLMQSLDFSSLTDAQKAEFAIMTSGFEGLRDTTAQSAAQMHADLSKLSDTQQWTLWASAISAVTSTVSWAFGSLSSVFSTTAKDAKAAADDIVASFQQSAAASVSYSGQISKASSDQLAGLRAASQQTGISSDQIARLNQMAQQSGVSFDTLRDGAMRLADAINGTGAQADTTRAALKAMGLSVADMTPSQMPAMLIQVVSALDQYQGGAARGKLASDALGASLGAIVNQHAPELATVLRDIGQQPTFTGLAEQALRAAAATTAAKNALDGMNRSDQQAIDMAKQIRATAALDASILSPWQTAKGWTAGFFDQLRVEVPMAWDRTAPELFGGRHIPVPKDFLKPDQDDSQKKPAPDDSPKEVATYEQLKKTLAEIDDEADGLSLQKRIDYWQNIVDRDMVGGADQEKIEAELRALQKKAKDDDLKGTLLSLDQDIQARRQNADEVLAVENQKLTQLLARKGADDNETIAQQNRVTAAEREAAAQHQQLALSSLQGDTQIAAADIAAQMAVIKSKRAAGEISATEEKSDLTQLEEQKYQIELASAKRRLGLINQYDVAGRRQALAEIRAMEAAHTAQVAQLNAAESASRMQALTASKQASFDEQEQTLRQTEALAVEEVNFKKAMHQISASDAVTQIQAAHTAEYNALRDMLNQELLLYQNNEAKVLEIKRRIAEMDRQYQLQTLQAQHQAIEQQESGLKTFMNDVSSSFGNSFSSIARGTTSAMSVVGNVIDGVVNKEASAILKSATNWLFGENTKTAGTEAGATTRTAIETEAAAQTKAVNATTATADIGTKANQAAAGAYNAMVGIPIIGPVLAPVAAGVAYAAVEGYSVISAAGGMGNVPYDDMPARLHRQELGLPSSIATPLRAAVAGGQGFGMPAANGNQSSAGSSSAGASSANGGTTELHAHFTGPINGADPATLGQTVLSVLDSAARNGIPSAYPNLQRAMGQGAR